MLSTGRHVWRLIVLWADIRTIRFEFYKDEESLALPDSKPAAIIFSEIPTMPSREPSPDLDELVGILEEVMRESGRPPHTLKDTRFFRDWGASGGVQEVIVQMITDPGVVAVAESLGWKLIQGTALGTGSFVTQQVLRKVTESRQAQQKEAQEVDDEQSAEMGVPIPEERVYESPPDLDYSIRSARSSVSSAYELEFDDLEVREANRLSDHSEVMISHPPSGRDFVAKIDRSGYAVSIRPLPE